MKAMDLGRDLSEKSGDDLGFAENVYDYVVKNISYDYDKANNLPLDYIPDIDETFNQAREYVLITHL